MNSRFQSLVLLAFFVMPFVQSCKNEKPAPPIGPLTLESKKIERKNGPDCDKPDTLIVNCAHVDFKYPVLKDGSDSLRQAVDGWAMEFMTAWVGMSEEPDNLPPLEEAITNFFNMHDEQVKEMPDGPAYYVAETRDTLLLNDGKYLTLKLDGYSYVGGAHPNASSSVATFDVATAKKVTLDQLVTDLDALKKAAEKKFREVRADLFKPESEGGYGFEFDETSPFKLADNTGLVKDGIYFIYVPYEVGAYAIGETEFVLPFSEIQGIRK
ncbi:MAG: DUF3298 and DUF4163 domain-containing protein [Saprospiraceae bacterium]|nr:DUF3298 and DUF4163 domain-containing protein [Saprospiraceae bacterium]